LPIVSAVCFNCKYLILIASQNITCIVGSISCGKLYSYKISTASLATLLLSAHEVVNNNASAKIGVYSGDPSTTDSVIAALAVRNHDLLEESDGINAGDLFVPFSYRYSDLYFPSTPTINFGDNEFVTGNPGQNSVLGNFEVWSTIESGVNMILVDCLE